MPDSGWSDSDSAAAAQVAVAGINYASAANTNKKQRKWAEEQYRKQRADALTDWHMQNDYNSPAAQMARFKAAKLNPHLIYGNQSNSPTIRSSETGSWNPQAPRADLSPAVDTFFSQYDLELKQAQTDNVRLQRELINQQILNTAAQTQATGVSTETSKFNLSQLQQRASTDIEQVKANLRKTEADIDKTTVDTRYTLDQNERAALINNQTLQKGLEEIANLQATREGTRSATLLTKQHLKNASVQEDISKLDRALKENGLQPHDPAYLRIGKKALDKIPNPKEFKKWVDEQVRKLGSFIHQKMY